MTARGWRPRKTRRALLLVPVVLAVVLVTGCGSEDEERAAAETVARFQAALAADDGGRACAQLTPAARSAVESDERIPCARGVLRLDLPPGRVSGSDAYMNAAVVRVGSGSTAFLDRAAGGWRVSAAGCTPTAADRPYDCELED